MRSVSNPHLLVLGLLSQLEVAFAETYTGACVLVTSQMQSCASRWDSIRTECTKSVTTNTIWPGPCECAYYANDLPCFDEWELCAAQAWTQVPQWFRDGVTSCVQKDSKYTIRAQLGPSANPFSLDLTRSILKTSGTDHSIAAATPTNSVSRSSTGSFSTTITLPPMTSTDPIFFNQTKKQAPEHLSRGAKAGIGGGIAVFFILILGALIAVVILKRRKSLTAAKSIESRYEKPELDGRGREKDVPSELEACQRSELEGSMPCYELENKSKT